MTTVPKLWKFTTLPEEALHNILSSRVLKNAKEHKYNKQQSVGLFIDEKTSTHIKYKDVSVIWGTSNYETKIGRKNIRKFRDKVTVDDLREGLVKPRVEKTKEEQKKRVKEKAEVFTPSWVCNLQNNLVDDSLLGEGAFNTIDKDNQKLWIPSESPVKFSENYSWEKYVTDRRLEIAAGEAPYLMNSYDATTGIYTPVRDGNSRFQRIGLLDRKLRVVSENISDYDEWLIASKIALKSIYGYEWQGDNLLLARLNMINTYFDYHKDFYEREGLPKPSKAKMTELAVEVAEIASWQLWQMDGLKQVIPETCSVNCDSCIKKLRHSHDGKLPVIMWGKELKVFEDFLDTERTK